MFSEERLEALAEKWEYVTECLVNEFNFGDFFAERSAYTFEHCTNAYNKNLRASLSFFDDILQFSNGISKAVFWFDDADYVIKIPFEDCSLDYCEIEAGNYQKAEKIGVEKFFCETAFLTSVTIFKGTANEQSVDLYISTRANVSEDVVSKAYSTVLDHYSLEENKNALQEGLDVEESLESIELMDETCTFQPSGFIYIKNFFEIEYDMSDEEKEKLWSFIIEEDIDDLHGGNIGMLDGRPVFIDYSGFSG